MAFAAMIGPIISGVAGMVGAMMSASAMQDQAAREEEVAARNAAVERQKASLEQAKGARASAQVAEAFEEKRAEQLALLAQGGLDTTSGTPLLLQTKFRADKAAEMDITMFNAKVAQADRNDKADITEYEGQLRADALRAQAGASLLGGVAALGKGMGSMIG